MEKIKFGSKWIEYKVQRGMRKKTVAITISPASQVIVLSPSYLNKYEIRDIVKKKAQWIIEKQEYFKNLLQLFPDKEFVSGEQILLLGKKYRLKIIKKNVNTIAKPQIQGRKISLEVDKILNQENRKQVIKDIFINWYQNQAEIIVKKRISKFSKLLGIKPDKIIIRNQQKRWGSCSSKGILRFNWKIAMMPISIIDYIVVHELCHISVKNHSTEFWKKVSLVISDYKKRRDWLKDNVGMFRM